jgi:heat-inducible transcriptional repressor
LAISGLPERPREIFRRLVEAYLTTGEPVGSRTLSQRLPINLSPASCAFLSTACSKSAI